MRERAIHLASRSTSPPGAGSRFRRPARGSRSRVRTRRPGPIRSHWSASRQATSSRLPSGDHSSPWTAPGPSNSVRVAPAGAPAPASATSTTRAPRRCWSSTAARRPRGAARAPVPLVRAGHAGGAVRVGRAPAAGRARAPRDERRSGSRRAPRPLVPGVTTASPRSRRRRSRCRPAGLGERVAGPRAPGGRDRGRAAAEQPVSRPVSSHDAQRRALEVGHEEAVAGGPRRVRDAAGPGHRPLRVPSGSTATTRPPLTPTTCSPRGDQPASLKAPTRRSEPSGRTTKAPVLESASALPPSGSAANAGVAGTGSAAKRDSIQSPRAGPAGVSTSTSAATAAASAGARLSASRGRLAAGSRSASAAATSGQARAPAATSPGSGCSPSRRRSSRSRALTAAPPERRQAVERASQP